MKKNLLLTLVAVVAFAFNSIAQGGGVTDVFGTPPQPGEYGKCYAKCKIPDQYDWITEQIPVSSESSKSSVVPSKFETYTEQIMVKPAYVKYISHPATFKTETQTYLAKEGGCDIKYIPAQYESNTTKTLKTPASGEWLRKEKVPNCLSDNPDDCYVLCWVEIPAQYDYSVSSNLVRGESYDTLYKDPVYKTMKVQVVNKPAWTEEVQIPAVYKTLSKQRLVRCASVNVTNIPAKYKTEKRKVLISKGGYTNWVEVVCDTDIDSYLIKRVQTKLNSLGYNCGTADGIMGSATKQALAKYQNDNNLPVGNLNIATMQKLGVQ